MREFWIEFGGDPSDDKEVYKRYCAAGPFKPNDFSDEVIHCREVNPAYDAAVEGLVKALKSAEGYMFMACQPDKGHLFSEFDDKNRAALKAFEKAKAAMK